MKRITAKVDTYTDSDGKEKGRYVDVGVILDNQYGEYIILNPTVDLAGVLIKQRLLNPSKAGGGVMCNIFSGDAPVSQTQTSQAQSAHQSEKANGYTADLDDDIPF